MKFFKHNAELTGDFLGGSDGKYTQWKLLFVAVVTMVEQFMRCIAWVENTV